MKTCIFDDKWIVVTGAFGMIGSGVVRYLNDLGHTNLILVDDLDASDKWKNLLGKKFAQIVGIRDLFPFLERHVSDIAAFIHLGACSDTLEKQGEYLLENNYRYTLRLVEYALANDKRFIYASSAATYGDGMLGFSDDHALLHSLRPLNLYGFSKHLFDLWAEKEGAFDRIVGLKYFNVFGPNENHKGHMSSMVYKMVPLIHQEGVLRLFQSSAPERFKDGQQCRDFLYVKDAVRLTVEFLENDLAGIYNIGSGVASSWNELARCVFQSMDHRVNIQYVPMPEQLKAQYQNFTCAEMEKLISARRVLGLGPLLEYSLETGVSDYIKEYLLKGNRW